MTLLMLVGMVAWVALGMAVAYWKGYCAGRDRAEDDLAILVRQVTPENPARRHP